MDIRRTSRLVIAVCAILALLVTGCADDVEDELDPVDVTDVANADMPDASNDAGDDAETPDDMGEDVAVPDMGGDDTGTDDMGQDDTGTEDTGPEVFRIDAVIPPRGSVDGGTSVVIKGSAFTPDSVVFFGGRRAEFELIGEDLVGETPPGPAPGPVNVKILDPAEGETDLQGGFEYVSPLEVTSVLPGDVPAEGGVEVTLEGRGFDTHTRASFGGETGLRHTLLDANTMRVVTPPHPAGSYDVRVTNRDASDILAAGITYFETLSIDAVRPATGLPAGGETVTLEGSGFEDGMIVEFGGVPATLQMVAAAGDTADVTTPAHAAGLVDVRVETPNGAAHLLEDGFYYATAGTFAATAIQPSQGPAVGGNEVTIIGSGLDATALSVTFDGNSATIVDQGPGHVTVQAPMHVVGVVDVTIDDGTQSDTLTGAYEYVENLWIDRVDPDTGDVAGGTTVVIEGEGFTGTTAVEFGGIAGQFTVDSDTKITATTPAHSAGVVDVEVIRDQVSATFVDAFTFTEALEVFSLSPPRGSVAGGTYVEIRGRGFVGSPAVDFGGAMSTDVTVLDSQTLAVMSPPHPSGAVDVTVDVNGDTVTAPEPYTYYNPGARFGGAWGGPINGAVNVAVYSTDGMPLEGAFVMLSTNPATPYQGYTDANGMVTLSGPDVYGEQTVTATYNLTSPQTPCSPALDWTASSTVQQLDAENITMFLNLDPPPPMGPTAEPEDGCEEGTNMCYCRTSPPPCDDGLACNPMTGICCPEPPPPPPGPPTATFTGDISGLDKLAEPGPTEFQMAIVYTTQKDPWSRNPDPGDGNVVLTDGAYTITTRTGDLALIAIGGLYNNTTQTFKPLRMGIERYLFASEDQTYTVDLDLNIPLDTALNFKVNGAARYTDGPNINRVVPYLDLGFEGVFGGVDVAEGDSDVVVAEHQAALSGILSDASYMAMGGTYRDQGVPMSIGITRGVTDTSKVISLPGLVGIAHVTSPQPGTPPSSGLVSFDLREPNEPDFFYVTITVPTLTGLKEMWNAFLPGDKRSLRLPDFPDFSSNPDGQQPSPYPPGTYLLDIIAVQKPGFQFQNYSYSDLDVGQWDSYSYSRTQITF